MGPRGYRQRRGREQKTEQSPASLVTLGRSGSWGVQPTFSHRKDGMGAGPEQTRPSKTPSLRIHPGCFSPWHCCLSDAPAPGMKEREGNASRAAQSLWKLSFMSVPPMALA